MSDFTDNTPKTKINIVGFSGKIGVGKNYISENIIGKKFYQLGYHVHFIGYGDFVKYEVGSRFEKTTSIDDNFILQMNQVFDGLFVNKKKEIRRTLQLYGTELSRHGGDIVLDKDNNIILHNEPNVWVKSVHLNIMNILSKSYNPQKDLFFITDVRFPNELQYIKSMRGISVRVNANQRNHDKLIQEAKKSNILPSTPEFEDFIFKAKSHASEISLDSHNDFDIILNNDYDDLDSIESQINDCIEKISNHFT